MQPKLLFLLPQTKSIIDFINPIECVNDDIIVSNRFIDDVEYKDSENIQGFYYLDTTTITNALKNNSILYVTYLNEKLCGVTMDDFYNADIIPMSIANFNDISTNFLDKYIDDLVIVWYDTKNHVKGKQIKNEINEVSFLLERIETLGYKYLYFLDDSEDDIANVINDFITGDDNKRKEILENYS
jgi:hypothetical protein